MLSSFNLCNLHDMGREWVRSCLGGGMTISRAVLQSTDIGAGNVYAAGVSCADISEFPDTPYPVAPQYSIAHLGILSRDASLEALFEVMRWLEEQRGSLAFVVEDDLHRPTDPTVLTRADNIIVGESMYHHREFGDISTPHKLGMYLSDSSSDHPLNAFVMRDTSRDTCAQALQADPAKLAQHVEAIVNSIFDCEGYSIWLGPT
ncbi:MAG: hypothetical protein ACYDGY_08500 [Acidimicrobiales bacterium]